MTIAKKHYKPEKCPKCGQPVKCISCGTGYAAGLVDQYPRFWVMPCGHHLLPGRDFTISWEGQADETGKG